jgi:hypothetical protein
VRIVWKSIEKQAREIPEYCTWRLMGNSGGSSEQNVMEMCRTLMRVQMQMGILLGIGFKAICVTFWKKNLSISATQEAERAGSWFKTSFGKSIRPYLKNKLKVKGMGAWLK